MNPLKAELTALAASVILGVSGVALFRDRGVESGLLLAE